MHKIQQCLFRLFIEWFFQQNEFKTQFENMEIVEMNMCLSKFYTTARRKDGSYYKKSSLMSKRLIKFYIPTWNTSWQLEKSLD